MRLDVAGRSDVGKVRSRNDDRYAIGHDVPGGGLVCVLADGMGGYTSGDLAATLAVQDVLDGVAAGKDLEAAVAAANAEIYRRSATEAEHRGMATTITSVLIRDGQAQFVHAGDSRLYLLRDGAARQLTMDHSWVGEEVRAGRLTSEEARRSPRRNIVTRALGLDSTVVTDTGTSLLVAGDALLLCSDGVHALVTDDELALACAKPAEQGSNDLIATVIARGAPDNATVVIARVLGDGAEAARVATTRPLPDIANGDTSPDTALLADKAPTVVGAAIDERPAARPAASHALLHWLLALLLFLTVAVLVVLLYTGILGAAV